MLEGREKKGGIQPGQKADEQGQAEKPRDDERAAEVGEAERDVARLTKLMPAMKRMRKATTVNSLT
jgi:hypothetical protein